MMPGEKRIELTCAANGFQRFRGPLHVRKHNSQ